MGREKGLPDGIHCRGIRVQGRTFPMGHAKRNLQAIIDLLFELFRFLILLPIGRHFNMVINGHCLRFLQFGQFVHKSVIKCSISVSEDRQG